MGIHAFFCLFGKLEQRTLRKLIFLDSKGPLNRTHGYKNGCARYNIVASVQSLKRQLKVGTQSTVRRYYSSLAGAQVPGWMGPRREKTITGNLKRCLINLLFYTRFQAAHFETSFPFSRTEKITPQLWHPLYGGLGATGRSLLLGGWTWQLVFPAEWWWPWAEYREHLVVGRSMAFDQQDWHNTGTGQS